MARITGIRTVALEHRLGAMKAYGMSRGMAEARGATLVLVDTDSGITGIGEAWGPGPAVAAAMDLVRPRFVGRRIHDRTQAPAAFHSQHYHMGVQNSVTSALGGVNIALYDAIGKLHGVPVHDLLGGLARDRVPAYASGGYFANDPAGGLEAQLAAVRDRRFPGVKIKIGHSPADDAARAALARDVIGPDTLLMVDANGNYTADQALASMAAVAPFDIHFYEEPLPPTDLAGYRHLRARAPLPVAAGEALYTAWDFKRLIEEGGADILQPDLTLCGGFDEAMAVAALARLANLRLSPHVWGGAVGLAAAVHFIAALPPAPHADRVPFPVLLELDRGENALRDSLLAEPLACIDGHVTVPRGPGLGIALDPDAVARYRADGAD